MKIETQPVEGHQVRLNVEIDSSVLPEFRKKAARRLANRIKIPGFRPGKAPYNIILRQLGDGAILEEALEILVDEQYPEIIHQSGIKPYGPGKLDKIVSMEPPVLEFVVPLEATVTLGDYRSIREDYQPELVTDQAVEDVLQDLRNQHAIIEPVDRPAQEGDVVTVRLSGHRKEGPAGPSIELINSQSRPIVITPIDTEAEEGAPEWPYPGFSKELIGLSVGDSRTIAHTYPEDSSYRMLRGADAEFSFIVEEVKSRTLPELNDAFASTVGEYADLVALRTEIRRILQSQSDDTYHESYDNKILDKLIALSEINYPPQMLEDEIDSVINGLERRLVEQNQDLDVYLKSRQLTMDKLREEANPTAVLRLKRSLVLVELARRENINIEENELQDETIQTLDSLNRSLSPKDAKKLSNRDVFQNLVGNIMANMMARKSLLRLREIAQGKEPEINEPEDKIERKHGSPELYSDNPDESKTEELQGN